MAKKKVRLKHVCNAAEHPGTPGDVIHVEEDLAASWAENGGAEAVDDDVPLTSEKKPAKGDSPKPAKPAPPAPKEVK